MELQNKGEPISSTRKKMAKEEGLIVEYDYLAMRIIGNVLGIIDLLDLPEPKKKTLRKLINQAVYDCIKTQDNSVWLSPKIIKNLPTEEDKWTQVVTTNPVSGICKTYVEGKEVK